MNHSKPFHNVIRYLTFTTLLLILPGGAAMAADTPPPKDPPPEAQRFESGLATLRLSPGTSDQRPDANDYVSVHYTIWSPGGTKIESSYDIGQPGAYLMETVMPAWRNSIQLMAVGEKRRLWIPGHLNNTRTGAGQPVICDLELLGWRPVTNLEPEDLTPPADAKRTIFGAYTRVLQEGSGEGSGEDGAAALSSFTLWTENGRVFDSTVVRNRPTLFPYDRVMPAFADVLKNMVVGEKRRIWIPGNVANGNWAGGPKGMLIFDVEVLQFMDSTLFTKPEGVESKGESG